MTRDTLSNQVALGIALAALTAMSGCGNDPSNPPLSIKHTALVTVADCPAGSNVIEGTDGPDVLDGTNKRDCILGYDGEDVIRGGNGADVIAGGLGNDQLYGGNGDDLVFGEGGSDHVFGEQGDDALSGGSGDDQISGDNGGDEIEGGPGNDVIDGGNGTNTISGGEGDDRINGGNSKDILYGEGGNDLIVPGGGADTVFAGGGHDVVVPGNDSMVSGGDGVDACDGLDCELDGPAATCEQDADCVNGRCDVVTGICIECLSDSECSDDNPCSADLCRPAAGCDYVNLPDGTSCGDADLCNGDETCQAGLCTPGTPLAARDWYIDGDGDGFGDQNVGPLMVCVQPPGYAAQDGDCDDARDDVYPGAVELCNDTDDDCDGQVDENYQIGYPRLGLTCASDYGLPDPGHGDCRVHGTFICSGATTIGCSVTEPDLNLASGETCDGRDNDCNGVIDDGVCICGNGTQEPRAAEECDDGNLVDGDGCSAGCLLEVCSNNRIDFGEVCDGSALAGETCASQSGLPDGSLACSGDCDAFDTADCHDCGSGALEGPEVCDGSELDGRSCASEGFPGSGLACAASCRTFDASGCSPAWAYRYYSGRVYGIEALGANNALVAAGSAVFEIDATGAVTSNIRLSTAAAQISVSANAAQPTADGGYVVAGTRSDTRPYIGGTVRPWAAKIADDGSLLWEHYFLNTVGGSFKPNMYGYAAFEMPSGQIAFGGGGGGYAWIALLDGATGSADTQALYPANLSSMRPTDDGGFIVCGAKGDDIWLAKLDSGLDLTWEQTYAVNAQDAGSMARQTADGGYIVLGRTVDGASDTQAVVIRTDATGTVIWHKVIAPAPGTFFFTYDILPLGDGSFVAVAADYLFGLAADGTLQWSRDYGANLRALAQADDGALLVGGTEDFDRLVVRATQDGLVGDCPFVVSSSLTDVAATLTASTSSTSETAHSVSANGSAADSEAGYLLRWEFCVP